MAKRRHSLSKDGLKKSRSHKTAKRLAAKKVMLEEKAAKRKNKSK